MLRFRSLWIGTFMLAVYFMVEKQNLLKIVSRHGNFATFNKTRLNQTLCLCASPPLRGEEVGQSEALKEIDAPICWNDVRKMKFDINFNVERKLKFVFKDRELPCQYTFRKDNNQVEIPKRFHFIWNNAKIPSMFVDNLKHFLDLHPNWEFNFWTLAHGRKLIQKLEPQLLDSYDRYKMDVSRADVLRYVVMYHFGGAYFDMDTYPRIPLDNLTTLYDCLIGPEPVESATFLLGLRSVLNNAAFLCVQKHPFYRHALDLLPHFTKKPEILSIAGPIFLSNVFNSFIRDNFDKMIKNNRSNEGEVRIGIVNHEYFEYLLTDLARRGTAKGCKTFRDNLIFKKCHGNKVFSPNCTDMFNKMTNKQRREFFACYDLVSHGGMHRNISDSIRYVDHKHAGTFHFLKKMKYEDETKLKKLIPDIKLHI